MSEVTVVGASIADVNFRLSPHFLGGLPNDQAISLPFGAKIEAKEYQLTPGGSGANVAVGLQRGGLNSMLISAFSIDPIGQLIKEKIEQERVKLIAIDEPEPSNLSVILRIKGERTIISAHTTPFNFLRQSLPKTGWLHIGPLPVREDDFYQRLLVHVAKTSQSFSFNPSVEMLTERSRHFSIALRSVKVLFVNHEEGLVFTRQSKRAAASEVAETLRHFGPEIVCLTCADKGAYVASASGVIFAPSAADQRNIIDATGAGDAFTSGFLISYLTGNGLADKVLVQRSLAFGVLNSAAVIAEVGGQAGLMSGEALEENWKAVRVKDMESS